MTHPSDGTRGSRRANAERADTAVTASRLGHLSTAVRWTIALVWLANGFVAKVLGLVPRHEQIVARILGPGDARTLTVAVGVAEVAMFAWVLSEWRPRINATVQIVAVSTMNVLEVAMAPDLLLWGYLNLVFAAGFVVLVYVHGFHLHGQRSRP